MKNVVLFVVLLNTTMCQTDCKILIYIQLFNFNIPSYQFFRNVYLIYTQTGRKCINYDVHIFDYIPEKTKQFIGPLLKPKNYSRTCFPRHCPIKRNDMAYKLPKKCVLRSNDTKILQHIKELPSVCFLIILG